jgi:hypothetical protein
MSESIDTTSKALTMLGSDVELRDSDDAQVKALEAELGISDEDLPAAGQIEQAGINPEELIPEPEMINPIPRRDELEKFQAFVDMAIGRAGRAIGLTEAGLPEDVERQQLEDAIEDMRNEFQADIENEGLTCPAVSTPIFARFATAEANPSFSISA